MYIAYHFSILTSLLMAIYLTFYKAPQNINANMHVWDTRACQIPNHCRNQCWLFIKFTLEKELQCHINQNALYFNYIQLKIPSENWRPSCSDFHVLMQLFHRKTAHKFFFLEQMLVRILQQSTTLWNGRLITICVDPLMPQVMTLGL